jgi:hypothetical protein
MKRLLKEKVNISKGTWLVVSAVVFIFLSRTIICQKGETTRIYHLWMYLFKEWNRVPFSDLWGSVVFTGMIVIPACIAGWFAATVVGIARMIAERNRRVEPPPAGDR